MDSQPTDNNVEHDSILTQFINITGADESIAKNTLEAFDWNLELAINMFVDSNLGSQTAASSSSTSTSTSSLRNDFQQNPNSSTSSSQYNSNEVRPPIPPRRQVLVEEYPRNLYHNSAYDGFRNFEQESRWQEQQLEDSEQSSLSSNNENRRRTFDDLFRPPLDLIFRGTFEMAKFEGQRKNKWILVNVQNQLEFACQVLNRDVWSNPTVRAIIKEHFLFFQTYHDISQGQNFISFYNVHCFPHISIIDPRTGEKVKSWQEVDTVTFCEQVTQFLNEHPSPSGQSNCESKDVAATKHPYEGSEEEQLEAAIKASLAEVEDANCIDLEKDRWKEFLGTDNSAKMELIIRFPDGNKEKVMFPSDSKLKALFLYVSEHGYNMNEYDLITNFPKKNLSDACDEMSTLESAGIHSRDTLYVQTKN